MEAIYYHIDAFTERVFGGNPAGVCCGTHAQPTEILQKITAENNLAETAFISGPEDGIYGLRWFTPTMEVDLCGHATLAAAHVLWRHKTASTPIVEDKIVFKTLSGLLTVTRDDKNLMTLDFPARPAEPVEPPLDAKEALSAQPISCWKARDYLFEFRTEGEIRALKPDFARLASWDQAFGVIVTAPGREVDFVSRFFAPRAGVPEDPVTGSAHCTLIPFWVERLRKTVLRARQVSSRGGELFCEAQGDRVKIAGHAVTYSRGVIEF